MANITMERFFLVLRYEDSRHDTLEGTSYADLRDALTAAEERYPIRSSYRHVSIDSLRDRVTGRIYTADEVDRMIADQQADDRAQAQHNHGVGAWHG